MEKLFINNNNKHIVSGIKQSNNTNTLFYNNKFKTYQRDFVVTNTLSNFNMEFSFGNGSWTAEIIIIVKQLSNVSNTSYSIIGFFCGGNIFTNTPRGNIQSLSIISGSPPLAYGAPNTASISYTPTTITFPCGVTDGSGVEYEIFVNFYCSNSSNTKLNSITINGTVWNPGY